MSGRMWLMALLYASLVCARLSYADTNAQPVPPDEASLLIESLRAGLYQWERDVAFKSTYVFKAGKSEGLADPQTGDYAQVELSVRGGGVLIKDGPHLHRTLDFEVGGLRLITPLPADGSRLRSFETAGVRPVQQLSSAAATLLYHPEVEIAGSPGWIDGASADFRASTPDQINSLTESSFQGSVCPLSPSSKTGVPISTYLDHDTFLPRSSAADIEQRVYRHDGDVIEVVMEDQTRTVRMTFWTAPFPPVLKTLIKTDRRPTKYGTYENRSVLSDFRQCRNGLVPARIVTTSKWSLRSIGSFKEWVSEDLGAEEPTVDDFVLYLPADTFIGGMTELPAVENGVRPIRVDGLRQDRVAQLPQNVADIIDPSAPPKASFQGQGGGRVWQLILFNLAVVCALVGYLFVTGRKRTAGRQHR